jgi:hypothetical protein
MLVGRRTFGPQAPFNLLRVSTPRLSDHEVLSIFAQFYPVKPSAQIPNRPRGHHKTSRNCIRNPIWVVARFRTVMALPLLSLMEHASQLPLEFGPYRRCGHHIL